MPPDAQSNNLDRRVQFLRADMIDDGFQIRPGPYQPHGAPFWAARKLIRDQEKYAAATVGVDSVARFVVRYSSFTVGISHQDRLECEGETFAITGIKEIGRRVGFEITASRIDR